MNPVVVTRGGCADLGPLAAGFIGSLTLGTGQYCTKPGLLLAPSSYGVPDAVVQALRDASPRGWALTAEIARSFATGVDDLLSAGAVPLANVDGPGTGFAMDATVVTAKPASLQPGSRLLEECFGPVGIVVEYADNAELRALIGGLPGALVASVMAGPDDPDLAWMLDLLAPLAGRLTVGDWPTGVAWTWAQQHGGPWPSTTDPTATSVGAAALDRFTRPVAYQRVPDHALPEALQGANPWGLRRRVDGAWRAP